MAFKNLILIVSSLLALSSIVPHCLGAPVPIPKELSNEIEEEEGLLVLVPTVPVDGKGQPTKREIDYELISIPSDLIRKTVREVTQSYGTRGGPLPQVGDVASTSSGSIFISDLNTNEADEIHIKSETKLESSASESYSQSKAPNSLSGDDFLRSFDDDHDSPLSASTPYGGAGNTNPLSAISSTDLSKILSSVASVGLNAASSGANIADQAKNALSTATRVGTSAVVGGTQAVRWAIQQKTSGLRTFAEFAGTGLQYAGRLSSAVLKVLLRIPGIKAKIISDLIQAGQPFATALSDVIAESADDMGDIFAAQTDIFRDAVNIFFKLIQDTLSLKGRVLASFGAGGLDKGANLISAGVKVGSAFVQTAGDVVSAVGRGVGELVQVASEANLPKPPALPSIKFPSLPKISYPDNSNSYSPPSNSYSASSNSYSAPSNSYKSPQPPTYKRATPSNSYSSSGLKIQQVFSS